MTTYRFDQPFLVSELTALTCPFCSEDLVRSKALSPGSIKLIRYECGSKPVNYIGQRRFVLCFIERTRILYNLGFRLHGGWDDPWVAMNSTQTVVGMPDYNYPIVEFPTRTEAFTLPQLTTYIEKALLLI